MSYTRAQALFADRKFGLFIHWGLYSVLGRGEWVMHNEKLPVEEYGALRHQFKGEKFDAEGIARLTVEAGMRYVCFTSRHHDGFCLFDSALTDYTTVRSAAGRDFVAEMAEACRRHGLGFAPYYSLWDWYHADFCPEDPPRWQRYLDYYHGQVRELCTNYGPLSGMWFDPGGGVGPDYDMKQTAEIVHSLQPEAAVMSWDYWVGEHTFKTMGRSDEAGRGILRSDPAEDLQPVLFEVCETINNSWGYNASDRNYKSAQQIIRYLVDVVGRGGNLLLNVGPLPDGSIDQESASRLKAVGTWLEENGEAIYGTRAVLHPRVNPLGYTTYREDRIYFFIPDVTPLLGRMAEGADPLEGLEGKTKVEFDGVRSRVEQVSALGKPEALEFEQEGTRLRVQIPRPVLRWRNFILRVETEGKAEVDGDVRPAADGSLVLPPEWAAIFTSTPGAPRDHRDAEGVKYIGSWRNPTAKAVWLARLEREAEYQVVVEQACEARAAGSVYELRVGDTVWQDTVRPTLSAADYVAVNVGCVRLKPGMVRVQLTPLVIRAGALMNIRSIRLVPK